MTLLGKLTRARKGAARRAYEKLETRILAAQGRKAVRAKAKTAAKVTRKAMKAGLIAGGMVAAGVVIRAVRKRPAGD